MIIFGEDQFIIRLVNDIFESPPHTISYFMPLSRDDSLILMHGLFFLDLHFLVRLTIEEKVELGLGSLDGPRLDGERFGEQLVDGSRIPLRLHLVFIR